jgi:acyl dehydratase
MVDDTPTVSAHTVLSLHDLTGAVGRELGASAWRLIDQQRIDRFADATDDHQWIHVDVDRAADSQWKGTIAHGFLVLSLIPSMLDEILLISDKTTGVNYGLDRLRFTNPVPSGSRIRLRATITDVKPIPGGVRYVFDAVVEMPALVATMVLLALE